MSFDEGINYIFTSDRRVQVVQELLDANEPLGVLTIRDRTYGLSGSVISKVLYKLRGAGLVKRFGGHLNGTFLIPPEMRGLVAALLEIHDTSGMREVE